MKTKKIEKLEKSELSKVKGGKKPIKEVDVVLVGGTLK